MKKACHCILILLFITCLTLTSTAWAKEILRTEITGINHNILKNVQERLIIVQQSYGKTLSQTEVHDFFKQAPNNIRKAIEPFGYFKAEIHGRLIEQAPNQWLARFTVGPGPPLKITQVNVTLSGMGADDTVIKHFIAHFPLTTGQVFQTEPYEKAKELLFQITNNQGYLKAFLEKKEILIDLKKYTAAIILHLNTGPRYYFGALSFAPSPFSPSFLHRFNTTIQPDMPFSSQRLLKFQENLSNSQYFKHVEVTPQVDQENQKNIPIDIKVTAPPAKKYNVGVGYGTFTGARLTLGVDMRRVTDTGQHFNAQVKLSEVLSGLAAKYYIPGNNPLTDQYTIGANVQKFVPKNGSSFARSLSASYVKNINEWQNTFSLNYLNESYQIEDQPSHTSQVFYPSFTLSRIKADNMLSPRSGNMISLNIQGAKENALSKISFFQTELKAKTIFSPTQHSRVILRGDLGYTVVDDLNFLPLTLRFFAGGLGSVRGYPYSSLGPGRYLEVASAEYQHRIYENWSGAVFYDVGTADDHFNSHLKLGIGVGVIYSSVIGAIQLYVARAESLSGKPFRAEFSIGSEF